MNFTITGLLVSDEPQATFANLTVEVFYRLGGQVIKSDKTPAGADGDFKFAFSDALLGNATTANPVEVFFQVYRANVLLPSRGGIDRLEAKSYQIEVAIEWPTGGNDTPPETDFYRIAGHVTFADGKAGSGLSVLAFDRDLRSEQQLGKASTDAKGQYEIRYTPALFRRAEKQAADLIVRVHDGNGLQLVESATLFNAPRDTTVHLVITSVEPSEFERNLACVQPVAEGVPLAELTDADLEFLSAECEISLDQLRALRLDAVWSKEQQLPPAACYGLLREGLPFDFVLLLDEKPSRWRKALQTATKANIAPSHLGNEVDTILGRLADLATAQAFADPAAGQPARLGRVLRTTTLAPTVQEQFVRFAHAYEGNGEFWDAFSSQSSADESTVAELRFATGSAPLLFGHVGVLEHIQTLKKQNGWRAARDLARLQRTDWRWIAAHSCVGGLPASFDSAQTYADAIADRVEAAFPTAVIAHRLESEPDIGGADLTAFVDANEGFDILGTRVDTFLGGELVLDDNVDRVSLGERLKKLQRTAFIAPALRRADSMLLLMREGYTSAFHVLSAGEETFRSTMVELIGGPGVGEVWSRAGARADMLTLFATQLRDQLIDVPAIIPALREPSDPGTATAAERVTLAGLFGSLNGCRCEHCASMVSAGAYMVDLLQYLRDAPFPGALIPVDTGPWLLDILFERRPDIRSIKLNCANATASVPYIDLVNEILEGAVVGQDSVPWQNYQTPEPEAGEPTSTYEARLLAAPAQVNADAYAVLSSVSYPWMLPFDASEELSLALGQHLGVDWAGLYQLFGRGDAAWVRAELGLRSADWALLAGPAASSAELKAHWGVDDGEDAVEVLSSAPEFAHRTGLTAEQVFELVQRTYFLSTGDGSPIAPVITLQPEGDSADPCDFNTYALGGLTERLLDQIHRFLRLRHRLGWAIVELDLVLAAGRRRVINRPVLIELAKVRQLARSFAKTPSQLATTGLSDLPRLLGISDSEVAGFATLVDIRPLRRLESLGPRLQLLERWIEFRDTRADIRELAYLLLGTDESPPAFAPLPEDTYRFLVELHSFVFAKREAGELGADDAVDAIGELSDLLIENLAAQLGVDSAVCERLVGRIAFDASADAEVEIIESLVRAETGAPATPAIAIIRDFVNLAAADLPPDVTDTITYPAYEAARKMLLRLDRVARLIRALDLSRPRLDTAMATRADNGFIDFDQIRTMPALSHLELFEGWLALARAAAMQAELTPARIDLFTTMAMAVDTALTDDAFLNAVATITGWNHDPLTGSETTNIANILTAMRFPADRQRAAFRSVATFTGVNAAMKLVRRWRVSVGTLIAWSKPARPWALQADSLQAAARVQQRDDAAWYTVLRPINDRLREARRDALLSHLLAHGATNADGSDGGKSFVDSADVYAHYLIDPEMNACMQTSRIVQANASIQLLVQRVLQRLEQAVPELAQSKADDWHRHWQRWPVMKAYRIWESDRRVFFHPENWVFPELRDDKSPLAIDFENALLQDELNEATVSRAYREYLAKLHQVGNLDIRGFYIDERYNTDDTTDSSRYLVRQVMHLFARTHSEPQLYFYRRRNMISGVWTAWEKVELNIEGDHLVPVVHNGELMLFWAQVREKGSVGEERGFSTYELNLAFSRLMDGGWTAPLTGMDAFVFPATERASLTLRAWVNSGGCGVVVLDDKDGVGRETISRATFEFDACTDALRRSARSNGRDEVYLPPRLKSEGTIFEEVEDDDSSDAFFLPDMAVGGVPARVSTQRILNSTPTRFSLVPGIQYLQMDGEHPYFFKDQSRSFMVRPEYTTLWTRSLSRDKRDPFGGSIGKELVRAQRFELSYHPFTCGFIERFASDGLTGLLAPPASATFDRQHVPNTTSPLVLPAPNGYDAIREVVAPPYPREQIDFDRRSAYANYNWELFFQLPLLVATRLSQSQKFEDAQRWFHYIFDPTDSSPHPVLARVWRVKPFFELAAETPTTLAQLLEKIARENAIAIEQVRTWRDDPFNPHAIARLRHVAYMKAVVMAYLDNLIAWADDLFQQFSRETISEAAQLYLLALEIMGARPLQLPAVERPALSYAELATPDELGTPWLALEALDSMIPIDPGSTSRSTRSDTPRLMPYFCLPANDKLLAYWDTVADRLFKIRHCMDIEGKLRSLPLFEPPIDPGLLVRARAAGVDLRSALLGSNQVPNYRFAVVHQKAVEFCAEVRSLGAAVLSALEKRDAEVLGLLRSTHELNLLNEMTEIRTRQVDETRETIASFTKSRDLAEVRRAFYRSRELVSTGEQSALTLELSSGSLAAVGQGYAAAAAIAGIIPQFHAQALASGTSTGGQQIASVLNAYADVAKLASGLKGLEASQAATMAGYGRRQDDWTLQADVSAN